MSTPASTPPASICPQHSGVEARLDNIESAQTEVKQRVAKLEDTVDQRLTKLTDAVTELGASMRAKGATIDIWTALLGGGVLSILSAIISQIVMKLAH